MAASLVQLIKNLSIQPILTPLTLPQNSMKIQEPKIITTLTIPDKMENVSNPNVVDEKKEIVDMSVFSTTASGRGSNDRLNKSRENIICRLINDPTLETSVSSIKKSLYEYLSKLAPANFDFKNSLHSVRCMMSIEIALGTEQPAAKIYMLLQAISSIQLCKPFNLCHVLWKPCWSHREAKRFPK